MIAVVTVALWAAALALLGAAWAPVLRTGALVTLDGLAGAFAAGLSIAALLGVAIDRAGQGHGALAVATAAAIGAGLVAGRRAGPSGPSRPDPAIPGRRRPSLAPVAVALGLVAWTAVTESLLLPGCDSWFHIGVIRRSASSGTIVPGLQDGTRFLNQGTYHATVALAARATGADPLQVFGRLPLVVAPLLFVAALRLARRLTRREDEAIAMACGFVLLLEGTHLDPLRQLAYPRYVAWIPLLVALSVVAERTRGTRRARAACVPLLAAGATAIHLLEGGFLVMILAGAALARWVSRDPLARRQAARLSGHLALSAAGVTAVVAALHPVAAAGVVRAAPGLARHPTLPGMLYLTDSLFVVDPFGEFGQTLGLAGLVTTAASPLLLPAVRSRAVTALLLGPTWLAPLVCLNPLVLPGFLAVLGVPAVAHRVALTSLFPLVLPLLALRLWRPRRGRRLACRLVLAGLLVAAAVPTLVLRAAGPSAAARDRTTLAAMGEVVAALDQSDRLEPVPSRVLTDPLTGYVAFAITRHEPLDWGSSRSAGLEGCLAGSPALAALRHEWQSSAALVSFLREGRIAFVLLHHSPAVRSWETSTYLAPYYGASTRALLADNPALFEPVTHGVTMDLYRVRQPLPAGPVKHKDAPPPGGAAACPGPTLDRPPIEAEGLSLASATMGQARLSPGETVRVSLCWRAVVPVTVAHRSVVIVTARPGPALLGPGLGMVERKARELLTGRVARFGSEAPVVGPERLGMPLDRGGLLSHVVEVPVPATATTGAFDVRVRCERLDRVRARRVCLSDDRPDSGARVGTIEVVPAGP